MSRSVHPAIYQALVERYQSQAERWGQACVRAGLREQPDMKDAKKFAEFQAMKPTDIIDWFKRRAARNEKWRRVVSQEFIDLLMEIRAWAQERESDVQRQAQILCAFVDMMANTAIFHLSV